MTFKNTFTILLFLCFAWLPVFTYAQTELNFGVYTSDKPTEMVKKFRPLLRAIESAVSQTLGKPIKIRLQVFRNYASGIEGLVSGKVDFARFGPASYVEAKGINPNLRILALESKHGTKVFRGIICVRKDSEVQRIADLRGKSFAFGNPRSTIGRYLSQQYLAEHGISSSDLAHYQYLGRHDKVGMAVGAGQFDAGALKESTFKKLVGQKIPIRAIASFPNVTKPWIARSGLSEPIYSALRQALLNMRDPIALKAVKKDGFLPGDETDFVTIRKAIEGNNAFFGKQG